MAKKRNTLQEKFKLKRKFSTLVISFFIVSFIGNFAYQLYKKPSEVFNFVMPTGGKSLQQTWRVYNSAFKAHSTDIMTADFLASMVQIESSGSPTASPRWRFNIKASLFNWYAPESSSVGLLQFTDGTFEQAKKYCIKNNQVKRVGPWWYFKSCWFNSLYSRLSPSDSIEMTSAQLHISVEEVLKNKNYPISYKQKVAALIHLCGKNKIRKWIRQGGQLSRLRSCGRHSTRQYLSKLIRFQKQFKRWL